MQTPYGQKPEIKLVSLAICRNCFDEPDKVIDAFLAKSSERRIDLYADSRFNLSLYRGRCIENPTSIYASLSGNNLELLNPEQREYLDRNPLELLCANTVFDGSGDIHLRFSHGFSRASTFKNFSTYNKK